MVLFIPGFMQRGDAWRPVAELLPERYPSRMLDHAEHSFEGRMREIREAAEADEKLASWIEAMPMEDVVSLWERQPLFADQSDALVEAQRPGRLSQDPRSLALLLRTAGQGALEPVWHELRALELPLLAIAGARDDGYSSAAKRIAHVAPNARA